MDKALQALMLSQYRLKLFEEHLLATKPVVLFKSLNIADSRAFYRRFLSCLAHLTGAQLDRWRTGRGDPAEGLCLFP